MSKFVIECPHCGSYAEGKTGFFARKKIDCTCGYTINVRTDKMTTRECPHCGNTVLCDQTKGTDAKCPVCHEQLVTQESMSALAEIACPSCSCKITVDKNAAGYTCPLCDTVIDVQKQIAAQTAKGEGLASLIKYEGGNDVFVWKHPIEDFNLGSQLIVHESQEAIFFKDGRALDLFGAGRYTLATQNLPLLQEIYKLPTNADTVFHSEIYFINMTTQMGVKWGTDSKVRLFDPGSGLHIEIGACGSFNIRVVNSRKLLLKVVGTASELSQNELVGGGFTTSAMVGKFKSLVMNKVKSILAKTIKEENINILEIDEHIDELSVKLRNEINITLDDYGLTLPEFFVTSIMTPDDDPNFRRLKQQFADKTLRVREEEIRKAEAEAAQGRRLVEAQTEAQLKMVGAQGEAEALKIKAMAEAEAYKAQAFAEAEEMKAKGYTYQQETARQVGLEAMQNGITGNGSGAVGGSLGDLASLGVTLGAMGGVMNMTKDALNPILNTASDVGSNIGNGIATTVETAKDTWNCPCGAMNISSKFCPDCGAKKPEPPAAWDCVNCGCKGITSKFCPDCGSPKPAAPAAWDCQKCGQTGITSNFCPNCGAKKE
ncbi:MAG: SPFH domain-containing protein [Lachnospiraceae bacterium]|nr:SPFH domain-containing protein [Lachnospiraceae bacterium]